MKSFLFRSLLVVFVTALAHLQADQDSYKNIEIDTSEVFSPEKAKKMSLRGKIIDGRYYSPQNIFSCRAMDFGQGRYLSQDSMTDMYCCVGFYDSIGNFRKAEVIFIPGLKTKALSKKQLKAAFENFGIGILKDVDNAQGIDILSEKFLEKDTLFTTVSIKKMSVLRAADGTCLSSTRGYLVFQEKDKLVLLSSQVTTPPGEEHSPKMHLDRIKAEILEFKNSFEFDPNVCLEHSSSNIAKHDETNA